MDFTQKLSKRSHWVSGSHGTKLNQQSKISYWQNWRERESAERVEGG